MKDYSNGFDIVLEFLKIIGGLLLLFITFILRKNNNDNNDNDNNDNDGVYRHTPSPIMPLFIASFMSQIPYKRNIPSRKSLYDNFIEGIDAFKTLVIQLNTGIGKIKCMMAD